MQSKILINHIAFPTADFKIGNIVIRLIYSNEFVNSCIVVPFLLAFTVAPEVS